MQSSDKSASDNSLSTPSENRKDGLRHFLTWVLLAGIVFNIISWGGAAGVLILRQSGVSVDWSEAGLLPVIQLDGPDIQQTVPPDATLPPTPLDITSVGQPSEPESSSTPTATRPAENTPAAQSETPPTTLAP